MANTIVNYQHNVNTYSTYQLIFGVDILTYLFILIFSLSTVPQKCYIVYNNTNHKNYDVYKNFYQLFSFSNKQFHNEIVYLNSELRDKDNRTN